MKSLTKMLPLAALAMSLWLPGLALADDVSFNYQGMIKAHNQAYTGTGYLKLAILNTDGQSVLWSNDGSVGTGSGPNSLPVPTGSIQVPISDGVFSVQVGDSNVPTMAALDSAVLVSDTPLRLRVWFSTDGATFEQLNPDQKLMDLTLSTIQTGKTDYTIYVNGESGNDANNGLTTATAKKTINGAVDILPDKIRCNITVNIAPGTYREMVLPNGISVKYGNTLAFVGDTSWTPGSSGIPGVIIDAADSGNTPVRDYGMNVSQCTNVTISGITFQNAKIAGLNLEDGTFNINRCLSQENAYSDMSTGIGFNAGPQSHTRFNECKATRNPNMGYCVHSSSRAFLTTCTATYNNVGLFTNANSTAQFFSYNNFSNNGVGAQANVLSDVSVWPGDNAETSTYIQNNTKAGVLVNWNGQFTASNAIITGNAQKYITYYGTIIP